MVEQPSILSSLRGPMATATVEPSPPDRLGGLAAFSPASPTEERSPDAVSSASEATESGQSQPAASSHTCQQVQHLSKEVLYANLIMELICGLSAGLMVSSCVPAALSPQVAPSAAESCFARQHNVSDNNNQCFSGANSHLSSQLAAQRPGAIDNQPLVTTDPMKANTSSVSVCRVCHAIKMIEML